MHRKLFILTSDNREPSGIFARHDYVERVYTQDFE